MHFSVWHKLVDASNCMCASACALIFAGGVNRSGNYLALHRPYLSPIAAKKIDGSTHEIKQKTVMKMVRDYMEEMEVPNYYTELMMSRNSQDVYVVSSDEVTNVNHLLSGLVPSIEEIVLSKCKLVTDSESELASKIAHKKSIATPAELEKLDDINRREMDGLECERATLSDLRHDAFVKEFSLNPRWRLSNVGNK